MAKKPKKMEDYVFPLAVWMTVLVYGTFFVALGIDLARAVRFIGNMYAISL